MIIAIMIIAIMIIIVAKTITIMIFIIDVTPSLLPFPCPFSPMVTEGISLGIIISSLDLQQQQKVEIWQKKETNIEFLTLLGQSLLRLIRNGTGQERGAGLCMFELTEAEEGWLTYV